MKEHFTEFSLNSIHSGKREIFIREGNFHHIISPRDGENANVNIHISLCKQCHMHIWVCIMGIAIATNFRLHDIELITTAKIL